MGTWIECSVWGFQGKVVIFPRKLAYLLVSEYMCI